MIFVKYTSEYHNSEIDPPEYYALQTNKLYVIVVRYLKELCYGKLYRGKRKIQHNSDHHHKNVI